MHLSGGLMDYFIVFWSGVLVSFTPCVYPLMPITAGFIAGFNTKGTRLMGFIVSSIFVFGMALTYGTLAIGAALSGRVFGQLQNQPVVFIVVGNVLLFFSFVMLDWIKIPNFGIAVHHKIKVKNIWTVVLFGMASGLIVGPCTAPILGTMLLYVGTRQNILHGASLLFVFAYGVGASLILVGTFSSILAHLPKSGPWLVRIKHACGLILLVAGEYYLLKAGELMI